MASSLRRIVRAAADGLWEVRLDYWAIGLGLVTGALLAALVAPGATGVVVSVVIGPLVFGPLWFAVIIGFQVACIRLSGPDSIQGDETERAASPDEDGMSEKGN